MKQIWSVLLVLSCLVGCTKSGSSDEILIGKYDSLSGNDAAFGVASGKGLQMALDEVNAAGGIKGKKVRIITLDDQSKSEEAAAVTTRLINQNHVVAVLGGMASGRSKAAAPIAQANKIPFVSHASTSPEVTQIGNFVFRICFIDPFQGKVAAQFAKENLKVKKAAILRDVKNDYSVGLADVFATEFKKGGGEIVADSSYMAGDVDFKAQLTQIRSTQPDLIFIPGYYSEMGLISKQARQLGIKSVFMGGDGWDSDRLYQIGREAIDGGYYVHHYSQESTVPYVANFVKKFKALYNNETPEVLSALNYDAAKVLFAAIEKAKDLSGESIRAELAKTKDFEGVTGRITLNENRDAVKSAVIVQVNKDKLKYITTIDP